MAAVCAAASLQQLLERMRPSSVEQTIKARGCQSNVLPLHKQRMEGIRESSTFVKRPPRQDLQQDSRAKDNEKANLKEKKAETRAWPLREGGAGARQVPANTSNHSLPVRCQRRMVQLSGW